jgi:hypothetical protein
MKRRIVSLGIFAPKRCNGALLRDARMIDLYRALKSLGFVETRWQYIFDDQIGGLVRPCNDGLNEVHVRFYPDRIFAEFEIARSSPLHFVYPAFNANKYVIQILSDKVAPQSLKYLEARTTSNFRDDELAQADWEPQGQPDPYQATRLFGSRFVNRLGVFCHPYLGWRRMLACTLVVALPLAMLIWPPITLALTLFAVLMWRAVPTTGRP